MIFDWGSEYGEIVDYLLDWLESEHMGSSAIAWNRIVEKWNITEETYIEKIGVDTNEQD